MTVAGARGLAHVDDAHDLDEGHDEGEARIADGLELPEARDDSDVALLDDAHRLDEEDDGEEHDDDRDAQDDEFHDVRFLGRRHRSSRGGSRGSVTRAAPIT